MLSFSVRVPTEPPVAKDYKNSRFTSILAAKNGMTTLRSAWYRNRMRHWLMKSEPEVFSIDDLREKRATLWDGVRNYQARNYMMNEMQVGDEVLFYHSNAEPPGVAGRARIVGKAEPDPSQFDKKSPYFEPKARADKPIWFGARVGFVEKFPRLVSLDEIRGEKALKDMLVLKRFQRLSIQPVAPKDFAWICKMAGR
jgi:predicted RNA-binding protein with PUA-like domain